MDDSMRTAASGMMAQQRMVDVIANNLANVNTTGFKRSRVNFQDVLYETIQGERIVRHPGVESTGPIQIGKGVRIAGVTRLDTQGSAETTQRPLDVAIEGEGYLQVQRPDGTVGYTRDGSLSLSDSGVLVTSGGYPVLPGVTVEALAADIAELCLADPRVERVHYPGLEQHPGHALAVRQMQGGYGAVVSFQVPGGAAEALAVTSRVRLFTRATSLGGVESLIEHRASMEGPLSQTPPNLIRMSVGLENVADLVADLEQALGG